MNTTTSAEAWAVAEKGLVPESAGNVQRDHMQIAFYAGFCEGVRGLIRALNSATTTDQANAIASGFSQEALRAITELVEMNTRGRPRTIQ